MRGPARWRGVRDEDAVSERAHEAVSGGRQSGRDPFMFWLER